MVIFCLSSGMWSTDIFLLPHACLEEHLTGTGGHDRASGSPLESWTSLSEPPVQKPNSHSQWSAPHVKGHWQDESVSQLVGELPDTSGVQGWEGAQL